MADWFRSWHGAPTDPKWRTIAKRAKVSPPLVIAVAWALMDRASQNGDRGSIAGFDVETIADFLDCEPEEIERVVSAMREKCVLTDDHFSAWEKRQPVREDGSAERAREWRERKQREKEAAERALAVGNANADVETHSNDCERTQTQPNANEHRVEQSRVDTEKITTLLTHASPSLDQLEAELRSAAQLETEPHPGLLDLSPILGLVEAGFELGSEILPVVRAKRRKGVRSWNYFVEAIREAREVRLSAGTRQVKARDGPGQQRATRGVHSALAGIEGFYATQDKD